MEIWKFVRNSTKAAVTKPMPGAFSPKEPSAPVTSLRLLHFGTSGPQNEHGQSSAGPRTNTARLQIH